MLIHQLQTSSLKPVWSVHVCSTKNYWDQGRAVFHKPENKLSCAQRGKIFCYIGLAREVLGLGVLGLKYRVLGLKMVVSDKSQWS